MELEVTIPKDTIISCLDVLNESPSWEAGPCDNIAWSVDRDTFFFADGACLKILNTYTTINWCLYNPLLGKDSPGFDEQVQVVKVMDDTAPILGLCADSTFGTDLDCANNAVMLTNVATDPGLCGSRKLRWQIDIDFNGDWTIDTTFSSDPIGDQIYVAPTSSGEEVKVTLPEEVLGSMENHRVVWTVKDGCGNQDVCETYFMVVDNIPPTPYCVNLSTALNEDGNVELWACDFDPSGGAYDNCSASGDLRYTFTDVAPDQDSTYNEASRCSFKTFDCDYITNAGANIFELEVYVWDEKDNSDFCTVFLTLVDNFMVCDSFTGTRPAMISGNIATEDGHMIEDVEVEINSNQPLYPNMQMTDNLGDFMFPSNPQEEDYSLQGTKNNDYLNGVSTIDLVMIQRHILGIEALTSPYDLIAADVNNDTQINGLDLVELRKLILGIYTELPQNDSWRFISKGVSMNPTYPWPLSEIRMILGLDTDMMTEDFIGVKIGDVSGDVIANAHQANSTSKVSGGINLQYQNLSFNSGDIVEMKVTSEDLTSFNALQFTLNISGLELVDFTGEGMEVTDGNFALLDNHITFSWNSNESVNDEELFTIKFIAKKAGTLANNVSLTSDVTVAEAYSADYSTLPVNLTGRNNSEHEFALYQNNPNPFNGKTVINFNLPENAEASISVLDITGRVIWTNKNTYTKGLNSITLTTEDFKTSGVLYYRIDSGSYSSTRKMIVLE